MPPGVSRYKCRGGLPISAVSHEVSSSFHSARRMRIGYRVLDFSPVLRLMSYPYFHSCGVCKNSVSTWIVCGERRNFMRQLYIYRCNVSNVSHPKTCWPEHSRMDAAPPKFSGSLG